MRLFTLITNTLAKDKEISDRWRGFKDVADSRPPRQPGRGARWSTRWSRAVREAYPRLSHRYYAMKAKWLGKDRLAHWDRNAPLPEKPERIVRVDRGAAIMVLDAYRGFAPEMAGIAGEFFDKRWIDAPARPGKAPGAFAASDGAVGAPVRAAQLPGQAARRDDARARARPRRASGAGGAPGRRCWRRRR